MTTAIIYTAENCPRCEHVKSLLRAACIEFEERSAAEWLTGSTVHPDWWEQRLVECRTVLALFNDQLPVVDCRGDDEFKTRVIKLWTVDPIPQCRDNVCEWKR